MEIHPHTNHDIARLRGEERLARALAAQSAREVAETAPGRRSLSAVGAVIHALQRIGRPRATAHARSSA